MPITENSTFNYRFNMVGTEEWRAKLQALAAEAGVKESAIVRDLVEQAYAERFGKKKPGAPVPKYNSAEARGTKKTRKK
ncbi:MAG TPA: hypothetical protein VK745_15070 [Polyangiaceae bacterium]|jgi:hypothetical protein|nr:hypothetical protein [Polyangiaceae bacterium]